MSEVMSAKELARYLGLHYRTVLALAKQGKIPGRRVGVTWRFHRPTIERWLADSSFDRRQQDDEEAAEPALSVHE